MPAEEQGVSLERYMLVPRTLVFILQGDRVLLLKGAVNKRLWPGLYNGIGGHVEQGEDILSAAKRELYEEAGIVPIKLWLCGTITIETQVNPGVCVFVFIGEAKVVGQQHSTEGILEWVKLEEVEHLPLVADLYTLLPIVRAMKYGDEPFSASSKYNEAGDLQITFH